jgi:glutathione peroxidase
MCELYDFEVTAIDGQRQRLDAYHGQVLLIVNVASQCGFTPQYAGLEALYRQYHAQGFAVLGFPCDQFGHQEPGDAAEIENFCKLKYDVTFPLFAKIDVNGPTADPLYKYLTRMRRGFLGTRAIKWNFTKFLVSRKGEVRRRFSPVVTANRLERDVSQLLSEPA